MGLERGLGARDSQKANIPVIFQWTSMVSSSGGTSSPAEGLWECLGNDKRNVHPGRSKGSATESEPGGNLELSPKIQEWLRVLAIPMGRREAKAASQYFLFSWFPEGIGTVLYGIFSPGFVQVLGTASHVFVHHLAWDCGIGIGMIPCVLAALDDKLRVIPVELFVPSFFLEFLKTPLSFRTREAPRISDTWISMCGNFSSFFSPDSHSRAPNCAQIPKDIWIFLFGLPCFSMGREWILWRSNGRNWNVNYESLGISLGCRI